MSQKRVFVSESLAVLQDALIAAVQTLKAADALTPLTIIVPSGLIGSQLSTAIARAGDGHLGLRFTTLTDFAVRRTEERPRRKRRVSAALAPLLVKKLLREQAGGGFQAFARQPRFPQFLSETLSDLKQAGIQPPQLQVFYTRIPAQDVLYREKIRNLLDVYTRYEEFLDERHLVDDAGLFTPASGQSTTSVCDGPLLVYGCTEYTARQRRFLEAIFTQGDALVFLPWRPGSAYEAVTPVLSWLNGRGFQSSPLARSPAPGCDLSQVQTRLFERAWEGEAPAQTGPRPVSTLQDTSPDTSLDTSLDISLDTSLQIISAPDQTQEAREIARVIFSLVREQDYTFDEIGVLLNESKTYGPLLLETLSRLGIPCTSVEEQPLLATRLGKAVQALCHIVSEDCPRQRLFAFLWRAHPPFQDLIGATVSEAHIAQWEALCLEAGIGRGGQEWRVRLAALEARYQNAVAGQAADSLRLLRLFVRFMARFLTDVKMVRDQQTWGGWVEHFLRLYTDYVSRDISCDTSCDVFSGVSSDIFSDIFWSDEALDREGAGQPGPDIEKTLRSLSPLFLSDETGRAEEWAGAVLALLSRAKVRPRKSQTSGVFLGDLAHAYGLRFRAVIMPGLAEESGPSLPSRDPILSDAERQHLAEVLTTDVPARRLVAEREQLLFTLATQSAQEVLCLTYPRSIHGLPRPPALLLLQTVSVLCGRQATLVDLKHRSRWIAGIPTPATAGIHAQGARHAVDALEFHLAYASAPASPHVSAPARHVENGSSLPAIHAGLQTLPFFAPAARAIAQRWDSPQLTAFDGCMQAEAVKNTLRQHLFPHGLRLSASRLETYARCPFRYFLETVLDLKPWEEPEQIFALLPRDRGVLVHAILYDFFSRLRQTDQLSLSTLPVDDERRLLTQITQITQIAEEHFAVFAQTRPVGLPLLWELEREHLTRRLHAFLQRERQTARDFRPEAFEVFFGIGAEETEKTAAEFFPIHSTPFLLDTGEEVQLRGRIDRVDVSAEHNAARILDYKTGRIPSWGFAGGTALQLALYLYAAQYLRPDLHWVCAEYTSVDGTAQHDKKSLTAETLAATLGTLRTILTRLAEGMTSGQFFPVADACLSCAFPGICHPHGPEWAEQKLQDPHTTAWRWVRSQA